MSGEPEESSHAGRLVESAGRRGWMLDPEAARRLIAYLRQILDENTRVNLTAVRELEPAVERHLLDGLALELHLRERGGLLDGARILDLGTGAGFPGVVAAALCPRAQVHLVESRAKKLHAVGRALDRAGITNVVLHPVRLAELLQREAPLRGGIDLVLARGVGPLATIVAEAAPALRTASGTLVCWKSADLSPEERREGKRRAAELGLVGLPELPYRSYKPCVLVRYSRGA